jgi:hypothetical protein
MSLRVSWRPPGMADTSHAFTNTEQCSKVASGKHRRGEIAEGGAVVVNIMDLKSVATDQRACPLGHSDVPRS